MVMRFKQRQAVAGRGAERVEKGLGFARVDIPPSGQFLRRDFQFKSGSEFMI
jgi:hypothetical protein